jgi:hypothetical protein
MPVVGCVPAPPPPEELEELELEEELELDEELELEVEVDVLPPVSVGASEEVVPPSAPPPSLPLSPEPV